MRPEIIDFADDLPVKAQVLDIECYPFHWHDALEIILVLEGQAVIGRDGKTCLLEENDIAVVNINEIHHIQQAGGENRLLVVQVEAGFCATIPDLKYSYIHCCSPCQENRAPEKYNLLKKDVLLLVSWIIEQTARIHIISCLEDTLVEMVDYFNFLRYGSGIRTFNEAQIRKHRCIFEYLANTPEKNWSLSALAEVTGITPRRISRDIKDKFGLTCRELLFYGKCIAAARLLLGTQKYVYEIAEECGFSGVKDLVRHFKRYYRCTPSNFREIHGKYGELTALQSGYRLFPLDSFRSHILENLAYLKTLESGPDNVPCMTEL